MKKVKLKGSGRGRVVPIRIGQRIVILTLSRVSDEEIRVNIIPKPLKADQRDDDAALTTSVGCYGYARSDAP
jgi:hypothetical protein